MNYTTPKPIKPSYIEKEIFKATLTKYEDKSSHNLSY